MRRRASEPVLTATYCRPPAIGPGLTTYLVIKTLAGRIRDCLYALVVMAAVFAAKLA